MPDSPAPTVEIPLPTLPKPIRSYLCQLCLKAAQACVAPDTTPGAWVERVEIDVLPELPEAFEARLFHPGVEEPSVLRYYPVSAEDNLPAVALFENGKSGHSPLRPATELRTRVDCLLRLALAMPGAATDLRGFHLPAEFAPGRVAIAEATGQGPASGNPTSAAGDESRAPGEPVGRGDVLPQFEDEGLTPAEDNLSFESLLTDIASGIPMTEGQQQAEPACRVWSVVGDEFATLILRWYDDGAALAVATYGATAGPDSAYQQLIGPLGEVLADSPPDHYRTHDLVLPGVTLRLLDDRAAMLHATNLLWHYTTLGGVGAAPLLKGGISEATRHRLYCLGEVAAPEAEEDGTDQIFGEIATALLENRTQWRWTSQKEHQNEGRIEALSDARYPESLILLAFDGTEVTPDVVAYWASDDVEQHGRFVNDLMELLCRRAIGSDRPLPLPPSTPYYRIPHPDLTDTLTHCLASWEAGKGQTFGVPGKALESAFTEVLDEVEATRDGTLAGQPGSRRVRNPSRLH